jgi:hypothetical protein
MYEGNFNYEITKKNILDASKKSKKIGRTYDDGLQPSCSNCFFRFLLEEMSIPLSVPFKCTYIREYFTYKYGVNFKDTASHCDEVEQNNLNKLLLKLNCNRTVKI